MANPRIQLNLVDKYAWYLYVETQYKGPGASRRYAAYWRQEGSPLQRPEHPPYGVAGTPEGAHGLARSRGVPVWVPVMHDDKRMPLVDTRRFRIGQRFDETVEVTGQDDAKAVRDVAKAKGMSGIEVWVRYPRSAHWCNAKEDVHTGNLFCTLELEHLSSIGKL